MEPLDPKLARLVHDGMVQAVPGPEVEDRVLRGLLARLPHGGPPGGEANELPRGSGGAPAPAEVAAAAKAGAAAGGKAWALVAVLGATAVTAGVVLGGRREPERQAAVAGERERASEGSAASARGGPAAGERGPVPSGTETASTQRGPTPESVTRPAPTSTSTGELGSSTTTMHSGSTSSPAPRRSDITSTSGRARERGSSASQPSGAVDSDRATADLGAGTDDLAAEIQQIAAADRALARGELREALRLAREHAVAHPSGQLRLERTAIELGARCQLGEPGAAEAAAAFLREHVDAPAAAKVRTRCASTK